MKNLSLFPAALRDCIGIFHRRAFAAAPLALLLAGCTQPNAEDGSVGETSEDVVVCPGANLVQGIDVSVYQGNINWGSVAGAKDFAIARVSDGSFLDTKFAQNWSGMKAAGIIRGAYQFFEPGEDGTTQANLLLSKMTGFGPGDLPPMLDMEVTGGQSPAAITAQIHKWVNTIQAATGRKPLIYTGKYFWDPDVQTNDFSSYPLVIAAYVKPNCPNTPNAWNNWTIWQYNDNGSIPGISGNTDVDEFNGTMTDLKKLAGDNADWGAQYVSQSFPLAVTALQMTVNESVSANMVLKNIGTKAWDANTKLATTQPRDRSSVFVAPDWLAPNRLAAVTGTVAPGANFKFNFTFHAPNKPGNYLEYFGMVEEGVAWFSDPGQAGPADNLFEAQIQVNAAEYQGEFVKQSFPALQDPAITMDVGDTLDGYFELKNVGTATWKAGETKLAPTPRDKPSSIGGADWLSPTRAATVAADVPPGSIGHFDVKLTPTKEGDFKQTFALVEETITWFADAPKGGGPPDDFMAIHVVVGAAQPTSGAGGSSGATEPTSGAGAGTTGEGGGQAETAAASGAGGSGGQGAGGGQDPALADDPGNAAGCSCSTETRAPSSPISALLAMSMLALAMRRRRG